MGDGQGGEYGVLGSRKGCVSLALENQLSHIVFWLGSGRRAGVGSLGE